MARSRFPTVELPRSRWTEFRRGTIKDTSMALLGHVVGVSECGRTYGLEYAHICEVVRALHPGARTSAACLRWYVGRALEGDPKYEADLPQARPRSPVSPPSPRRLGPPREDRSTDRGSADLPRNYPSRTAD